MHENTHSNTRSFLCEVCGKGFNTVTNLRAHRRRLAHYQTSKLSCHQCGKSFISEQNLENHICGTHVKFKKQETRPPQITKLCEECGQVCETDDLLNAHMHDLHPETRSGDHNQEIDTDDLSDKIITEDNDLEASNNHSEIASPNPVEFLNSLTELGESDNRSVGSDSNNNDSIAAETPAIDYSESEVEFDCDITPLNLDSYDTVVESVATTPMVQTVSTKPNRLAHKDTNVKDKNGRKCPICKLVLTKRVNFDQHVELHNGQQDFPCKECPARYGSVPQLINHTKRRHNITGFKSHCRICGRSFPKESFRSHQRDAHGVANIETTFDHDNNLISFECHACNETFQKETYVIDGDQIQVPCQHGNCSCKATFSDFRYFLDHHKKICTLLYWINRPATKSASYRKAGSIKCQFCEKTFGRQDILDAHVLIHHTEEKNLQERQAGNQTINTRGKVEGAVSTAQIGSAGGQHVCEICGKCFKLASYLRYHSSTHTGDRPFQCEVCGKDFRTLSNLKEHADIHVDATFPCYVCGKLFKTQKNVKNHVYSAHEKRRPPRNKKKIQTN
ncbi:unnamed protein product [Allacma fusca]|uniref:C2H2-type domain-containing protein n=1 Tax=Allacma fusca TaxID=39272 RepID=A0A8J2JUB9_9HEXA|nr:unnamed protein product [Allacma fusca]